MLEGCVVFCVFAMGFTRVVLGIAIRLLLRTGGGVELFEGARYEATDKGGTTVKA
ncbi:hypothetical protein K4L44_11990 [Halosquirtibacter laminarini]|uniref:Uncharacterized protein n=1 Tax=Halosquirtibacter laminarini TaxID=3374600 RepID=A0AC61NIX3_9BACT|nr:hypothetical protein K4L44_11990 [Prolixibacteraceae bacterium]